MRNDLKMNPILKHFPWATPEEQVLLRAEFMRRAALGFEEGKMWRDAAECWSSLGEHARAGELHARISDLGNAAMSQAGAGRYAGALDLYLQWESGLAKGDIVNRLRALLGQARCHFSGADPKKKMGTLSRKAGLEAYTRARVLLESEDDRDSRTASRCWAALAEYGAEMNRYDLVMEGYELALECDNSAEIIRAYLSEARERDDRVLIRTLEERLAESEETEELPPDPGELWTEPETGMEFVYVPGGTFMMGDIFDDEHWNDEKPIHEVEVSAFYMGKYPVTFNEYDLFCEESDRKKPNDRGWGRGRRPVIYVSWEDANAFAEWLSEKTGHTFRLPTEAEWEYAARSGGMEHRYSGTSEEDELGQYAWYWGNSGRKTHPVGEKKPNALGIHDMSGNVREWCQDIYAEDAYSKHQDNDPIYMPSGSSRVLRSGSWTSGARSCRSAFRRATSPGGRGNDLGFRLLRTP